jgi:hypothetical protein
MATEEDYMKMKNDADEFYAAFKKQLTEIDDIANIILKGHLIIESTLDDILRVLFFHPEQILESGNRFGFERKVQILRAMLVGSNNHPHWKIVLAVNSLRNEIAHKHAGEERHRKINRLREVCMAEVVPETKKHLENAPDDEVATFGCAACEGFLAVVLDDFIAMREQLDKLNDSFSLGKETRKLNRRSASQVTQD